MMDLALFDLDDTLICEASTSLWIRWLVSQGFAPETLIAEQQALITRYHQGTLPMEEYMNLTLAPLAGLSRLTVSGWVRRFVHRDIMPRVYPAARERLAWHQQRGDIIMIVSTSGEHLALPIAQRLGAHGALTTGVEIVDDRYSGLSGGALSYRDGKGVSADWQTLRHNGDFRHTWAYSDSINDLPLLAQADYACAINPDAQLQQEALARGWEIYRWVK